LAIKPGLVKSWDVSDPLNYKFTLQTGVKYHDGTAFSGQSVKANIERYKNGATSRRKSDLASVKSVEVVDDGHVTFHLSTQNAMLAALKTGDIDIARTIAAKDVASLKADTSFVYHDVPAIGFNGFELNAGAAPFNDPAKRQAVAMAVDRYSILKNINFNIGVVAYGPIPPSSWAFDGSEKIFDHADAAKAKSIATGFTFTY